MQAMTAPAGSTPNLACADKQAAKARQTAQRRDFVFGKKIGLETKNVHFQIPAIAIGVNRTGRREIHISARDAIRMPADFMHAAPAVHDVKRVVIGVQMQAAIAQGVVGLAMIKQRQRAARQFALKLLLEIFDGKHA